MNHKAEPSGIGGWLILPMLGLMITPFGLGTMLVTLFYPIFAEGYWELLTSPESPAYHPLWGPIIIFEIIGNVFFMVTAVVLLVLFFQKNHRFPLLMIWCLALNPVFILVDNGLVDMIPAIADEADEESSRDLTVTIIGAAIWIPYFLKSVRVKNTFVRGKSKKDDNQPRTVPPPIFK